MTMKIVDGVATLRAYYSGFLQWIHLTALAVFVFPYAWFVTRYCSAARFTPQEYGDWIPLWTALLRYIWSGGMEWETEWRFHWSFVLFVVALGYNCLRLVLFCKTKQLELHQEASGLPVLFTLEHSWWGTVFKIANVLMVLNIAAIAANTIHFLTQKIPTWP